MLLIKSAALDNKEILLYLPLDLLLLGINPA